MTSFPEWATTGKTPDRERNIITSLDLDSAEQEKFNLRLQEKYRKLEAEEVRFELTDAEDADYLLVAYGTSARICQKSVRLARDQGIKAGLLRPVTLFPFPKKPLKELAGKVKGIMTVEMSTGQMVEDVRLAVEGVVQVEHYGRMGGIIPTPEEIVDALGKNFLK